MVELGERLAEPTDRVHATGEQLPGGDHDHVPALDLGPARRPIPESTLIGASGARLGVRADQAQ